MRFVRAAVNPQLYGRLRSPACTFVAARSNPETQLGSLIVFCGAETSSTWVAHTPFNTANPTVTLRRSQASLPTPSPRMQQGDAPPYVPRNVVWASC